MGYSLPPGVRQTVESPRALSTAELTDLVLPLGKIYQSWGLSGKHPQKKLNTQASSQPLRLCLCFEDWWSCKPSHTIVGSHLSVPLLILFLSLLPFASSSHRLPRVHCRLLLLLLPSPPPRRTLFSRGCLQPHAPRRQATPLTACPPIRNHNHTRTSACSALRIPARPAGARIREARDLRTSVDFTLHACFIRQRGVLVCKRA